MADYPAPPWDTHGFSVMAPCLTPASRISLPEPLEPVVMAGQCQGFLSYVSYRAPSPLEYDELVWMPCMARDRGTGRRGYYVAVMYVNLAASRDAGRELWKLPKTLARFEPRSDGVDVTADDGTRVGLSFQLLGPGLSLDSRVTTLQPHQGGAVRFRGTFRSRTRLARVRLQNFDSTLPAWDTFRSARLLGRLGVGLEPFRAVMHPAD